MTFSKALLVLCLITLPVAAAGSPPPGTPGDEPFLLRVVGHTGDWQAQAENGTVRSRTRFYVTARQSETDPLPPIFELDPAGFGLRLARGSALVKQVGNFGGDGGLGQQGACTLLMIDVSGGMVQFWDIIHKAAKVSVKNMMPGDRLGIAFFGGGWEFSGFQITRNREKLDAFVEDQLPASFFADSQERRQLGYRDYVRKYNRNVNWWQGKVSKNLDIRTTKLFYLLQAEAIPALAECGGEVRALVILSDMVDESMVGVRGECTSENGCATFDQVKSSALERRVPLFMIGFESPDPETGATGNVDALEQAKLMARLTRGEFRQTADLTDMDVLFADVRKALNRLIVMDVEFGNLPVPKGDSDTNSLTVYYRAPDRFPQDIESLSYLISARELTSVPDFPVLCMPPCEEQYSAANQHLAGVNQGEELTVECRDGRCVPVIEAPCCRDNADCAPPTECLMPGETVTQSEPACNTLSETVIRVLQANIRIGTCGLRDGPVCCERSEECEPPRQCLSEEKTSTFDPTCKELQKNTCAIPIPVDVDPCRDQMCKTWNEATRSCEYVRCDYENDTGCGLGCVCREGTGDMPAHCEPRGTECRRDSDCTARCEDTSKPCICELVEDDPAQCPVAPWRRTGRRHCVTLDGNPDVNREAGEFLTEDHHHVHCLACETDADCVEKYKLPGYVCGCERGGKKICCPEVEPWWVKALRIALPILIGLVLVVFLVRVSRQPRRTRRPPGGGARRSEEPGFKAPEK
ncbi:MAG: hypothetical protein ABIK09_10090 [Pseudomonadota bacterium]